MDEFRAAVLGIVQGLTEFLPVSSSGHLILVPALFDWPDQGLAFDVGLHLGTLVALLAYFWRDWLHMTAAVPRLLRARFRPDPADPHAHLLTLIVVGSIPAAVVGLALAPWIEDHLRAAWLVAIALAAVAVVMLVAERTASHIRPLADMRLADALIIGLAQACALVPGVSRSGATISAALFRDFARADAARFAFLLGTPSFLGAALVKSPDLADSAAAGLGELAIGFAFSAIFGLLAIHFLLRYLRTRSLLPFVWYRLVVAAITLVIAAIRVA